VVVAGSTCNNLLKTNNKIDPAVCAVLCWFFAGKRVVVVGGGRTALDYASMIAASQQAAHVTWLYRQVRFVA
jgi:thioredoxin reductase